VLTVTLGACASLPRPVLQPHSQPITHIGINAGPERFTPDYLEHFSGWGTITIRTGVHSADEARRVLQSLPPYPSLRVLLLIEKADRALLGQLLAVKELPQLAGIELGNEMDLAGLSADEFAVWMQTAHDLLAAGGWPHDVISGGIYTVTDQTLRYAAPALARVPCEVLFGVHLYGDSSDRVLANLQQAAGCHKIAVTEFGMPSRTSSEDQAQAVYVNEKLAAFRLVGATYALIYQCCSAPDNSNLSNFGLQRADGSWKPFRPIAR
jgi:hypothetical protein